MAECPLLPQLSIQLGYTQYLEHITRRDLHHVQGDASIPSANINPARPVYPLGTPTIVTSAILLSRYYRTSQHLSSGYVLFAPYLVGERRRALSSVEPDTYGSWPGGGPSSWRTALLRHSHPGRGPSCRIVDSEAVYGTSGWDGSPSMFRTAWGGRFCRKI
jgi:hypothetical protein